MDFNLHYNSLAMTPCTIKTPRWTCSDREKTRAEGDAVNVCAVIVCVVNVCVVNVCVVNVCAVNVCAVNACAVNVCAVNVCAVNVCAVNVCAYKRIRGESRVDGVIDRSDARIIAQRGPLKLPRRCIEAQALQRTNYTTCMCIVSYSVSGLETRVWCKEKKGFQSVTLAKYIAYTIIAHTAIYMNLLFTI